MQWLGDLIHAEDHERRLANLVRTGAIETRVTEQEPIGPQIWPVSGPALRPSAPLREARRRRGSRLKREDHTVVRNDRELYSDLESYLRGEVLRILTAAEAPIGLADIAAELQLPLSGEEGRAVVTALHHLKDEGAIVVTLGGGKGSPFRYSVGSVR